MQRYVTSNEKRRKGFTALGDLLEKFETQENKYVSREFQTYGLLLAEELGDVKHKSLYIKMSRDEDRSILEAARSFVKDANARSKGRLFMWKIKQIKEERAAKKPKVQELSLF